MTNDLAAFLRGLFRRRRPVPVLRSSRVNIAVLEYDLHGVQPEPGSVASAVIGLRMLANSGTTSREMLHRMTDCPATGTITLDHHQIGVVCNLAPHQGGPHHDVVHGDWLASGVLTAEMLTTALDNLSRHDIKPDQPMILPPDVEWTR